MFLECSATDILKEVPTGKTGTSYTSIKMGMGELVEIYLQNKLLLCSC